jgi:hypothetical protein
MVKNSRIRRTKRRDSTKRLKRRGTKRRYSAKNKKLSGGMVRHTGPIRVNVVSGTLFSIERVDLKVKTLKDFIAIFLNSGCAHLGEQVAREVSVATTSENIHIISPEIDYDGEVFLHTIADDHVSVSFRSPPEGGLSL